MLTRLTNQVSRQPVVRQFVKFSLVGIANTITHTAVYLAATRLMDFEPLVANALAFIVAVTLSFSLNRRWTFRSQSAQVRQQYTKFMLVSLAGLGWSELIIYLVHYRFGWHDLIAFMVAVGIVMFWNFSLNKLWTFRSP